MAYSYVIYTPDGATQTFTVTFPFINTEHVKAFVDDVEDTTFTWPTSSTITLTAMPDAGSNVVIKRNTPQDERLVDFQPGNTISEDNLDTDSDQNFFAMQEVLEEHSNKLGLDVLDSEWDAESYQMKNLAAPTEDRHIVTLAYLNDTFAEQVEETLRDYFYIDATEADQGVTGDGKTIKAAVDSAGTKNLTVIIRHNGDGDTTPITLTTNLTVPKNVKLEVKHGAIFTGTGTLIIESVFQPGPTQVFQPDFKVRFGPGVIKDAYPQLWGAQGVGVSFDDSPAIDAAFECLMSNEGFSSWEIAGGNEIPGAAITAPTLFFPPGDYNYDGTGVVWTAGHRTLIMKATQGTVRIRVAEGVYLVTFELADNCFVEGINFYGGKGYLKFNSTAVNVRGRLFIQHCWFSYYTECAMGNRSLTGMPYITIRDNIFIGRAGEATIGIALGSRIDDTIINNNSFLRNKYHIKLGGDGVGLSGQIYLRTNSFFRWDTTTDKVADIWIVPDDDSPMGIDSGRNLRIDKNKFGNENQQVDDIRILVADEDTGTGTDRLSYHK